MSSLNIKWITDSVVSVVEKEHLAEASRSLRRSLPAKFWIGSEVRSSFVLNDEKFDLTCLLAGAFRPTPVEDSLRAHPRLGNFP